MANIDLERRTYRIWPWVLVLLGVLLLAWLAWTTLARGPADADVVMTPVDVEGGQMVMQETEGAPAEVVAGATGGSVERFARTCGARPDGAASGRGAEWELACLREMTNALAGLVLADTTGAARLDDQLRELRRQVQAAERDRLTASQDPTRFGEIARGATELMAELRSARQPSLESGGHLTRARRSLDTLQGMDRPDDVRRATEEFFSASAEVMREMESPAR